MKLLYKAGERICRCGGAFVPVDPNWRNAPSGYCLKLKCSNQDCKETSFAVASKEEVTNGSSDWNENDYGR